MGGMAGVGVAPPPNHPPTSLAGGSTRARHPGPSIARARCGGKRYPGCLSVPLPPKSPDFHPRQSPPNRPVPHRQVRRCSGKAHSRARTAAAAALARSIARAVCGGCGGGGGRLHRPSRALRAPRVTRVYAYVITAHRARHRRFPSPPCTTGTRALQRRRRSLAPSIARARCGGGDGDGGCGRSRRAPHASRAPRITRAHVRVINGRYARHYRSLPPARTHAYAAAEAALARSLDCARAVWRETPSWVPFGAAPPQVTRLTPPDNPLQTAPFLIARYDDARAKPTHARALRRRRRSLARSIARAVCGGCGGGGGRLHRPSRALRAPRVTRVYAYVITAHRARHRRFPFPPCTTGTRALQRRRRSLAPSIARARCGGGDGDGGCGRSRRAPHASRAPRITRAHVRVINGRYARHYRSLPPARTHAYAAAEAALARSLDCARAVWRETPSWVPFGAAPPQVTRLTPPDNPLQTVPFLIARYDDARAKPTHARALRRRRRSLARSRARCVAVAVEVAGGYIARHARYARRASRAYMRTSSPRIARVIAVFRPPRARPARARCSGGGARSLVARVRWDVAARAHVRHHAHACDHDVVPPPDSHAALRGGALTRRSIARTRCGDGEACASRRTSRAYATRARHQRAIRASLPFPSPPRTRTPTLQRKRRSLAPSIARARCGGKRHPGCLSVPLPPKSPDSPPLTIPSKPSRSSSPGTTMLGQSPLTRVHCGGGGARSLARSRARCVAVAVEVAGGYIARHARYARRASRACTRTSITAHRARHHRPPSPMSPMRARGSGGGAVSFARLLARAEAEAVGLGEAVGYIARHAFQTRHARRSSRARTRISSPLRARHHRFPPPPRTTGTRALLRRRRSLARSIARTRCGVGGGGGVQLHRDVTRVTRAHARHHRASRASSPFLFPPRAHTRALRRRRRSLAR